MFFRENEDIQEVVEIDMNIKIDHIDYLLVFNKLLR
jgi:hypothetical protein